MSLITIRPGVVFRPDAAASFRRYERALGRQADVNRTTSSYAVQENLYRLRQAGKYPYPVANPRTSNHVYRSDTDGGNAWDTDERGPLLDEHGWLATVKDEPWHREYHRDHDQHINDTQEDDMPLNADTDYEAFKTMLQRALRYDVRPNGAGADWHLGPTIWERLNVIEAAAKTGVTIDPTGLAKAVADAIPDNLAADVATELSKRLAS